jgi:hypothetical protein
LSEVWIQGSGTVQKCHESATLIKTINVTNLEHEIVYFQILLFDHVLEQLLVHRVLLQGLLHLIIQLPDFRGKFEFLLSEQQRRLLH